MNTQTYTIKKAWKISESGKDVPDGYDLFCNNEWCERFQFKKDAKSVVDNEIKNNPHNTVYKTK